MKGTHPRSKKPKKYILNDLLPPKFCRSPLAQIAGVRAIKAIRIMTITDDFWASTRKPTISGGVRLREAYWGFAVAEATNQDSHLEASIKGLGLLGFPGIGVLLAASGVFGQPLLSPLSITVIVSFWVSGFFLYFYAKRGLLRALQVDVAHAVFRLGTENKTGQFREGLKLPFSKIESIFLMRESSGASSARLFMRLKASSEPVFVLSGPEKVLMPVLERIIASVTGKKGGRKARTRTTVRFMQAKFF